MSVNHRLITKEIIKKHAFSGIFKGRWYVQEYKIKGWYSFFPLLHFARIGVFENNAPNPEFSLSDYKMLNPDIEHYEGGALLHYLFFGYKENRYVNFKDAVLHKHSAFNFAEDYEKWILKNENQEKKSISPEFFKANPVISILCPVYDVAEHYLTQCIESVLHQTYPFWELCIAYSGTKFEENFTYIRSLSELDNRINFVRIENQGIAENTNIALGMATGEFIALLDHDDFLAKYALESMVFAIDNHPEADFLYSDKDLFDESTQSRVLPLFKPCWSPAMMFSANYPTHFNVIRREVIIKVGGLRSMTNGSQDWDIFLRVTELSRSIIRVPGILYHWRLHPGSTSMGIQSKPYVLEGQMVTLTDALKRNLLSAKAQYDPFSGYHILWQLNKPHSVHILIDGTQSSPNKLWSFLHKIHGDTDSPILSSAIISIFHNMELDMTKLPSKPNITLQFYQVEHPRYLTEEIHRAIKSLENRADTLIFLDARISIIEKNWLTEMLGWTLYPKNIGVCGGLILDPTLKKMLEGGLILDQTGQGHPLFRGESWYGNTCFGGVAWYRNFRGFHPWFASVKCETYLQSAGFDANENWHDSFRKFCAILHETGKTGLFNPHLKASMDVNEMHPLPAFHYTCREDPYFHPVFQSVCPLTLSHVDVIAKPFTMSEYTMEASDLVSLLNGIPPIEKEHELTLRNTMNSKIEPKEIHWFIPHISHVDYGGAKTIFRLADYLHRKAGLKSSFVVVTEQPVDDLKEKVQMSYPSLAEANFFVTSTYFETISRPADICIATLWVTAYFIKKWTPREKWFYMVQDHEPDFYPAGSLNSMAKETYRMNFQVIANTEGLFTYLNQKYGCKGTYFTPQIDHHIFYPPKEKTKRDWKRIVFYARPNHPRNGFEIAAEALKMVKRELGYSVEILCVGDELDLVMFGLERIVTNLGLLTYEETAALYRQCDIGLTLMMTKHPSYLPLEFMASGLLLVTNENPAHDWLLKKGENCLMAPAMPTLLAEQLIKAVLEFKDLEHIRRQAIIDVSHLNDWDEAFEPVRHFLEGRFPEKPDVSIAI